MSALVRLYPRSWRERYEIEFLAVLASRPPSVGDRVDIVRGAMDARLHPELSGDRDPSRRRLRACLALPASQARRWGTSPDSLRVWCRW